jgi:hypothetical protein
LGVQGFATNIIKRVPIASDFGYLIIDNLMVASDYMDCSNKTISHLEFQLTNTAGYDLNIYGNVSFTIVFIKMTFLILF